MMPELAIHCFYYWNVTPFWPARQKCIASQLNNTMKHFFSATLAALLCALVPLSAQPVVVLSIPDVVAPAGSTEVCVPIVADTFDNIVTVQFSLEWDTTQIELSEIRLGDNPYGFEGMFSSMPTADNLGISFIPTNSMGVTLDAGTVLFEACFNTTMMEGSSTVTFDGFLEPEFAQDDGTFMARPYSVSGGSISYGDGAAVSVLPGDTDNNGQVDHRDLLNIGYILGTTGPARNGASSAFSPQSSPLWDGSFASGLNHAAADADGDGTVAENDLGIVSTNYGRASGDFTLAPDVSTTTGPTLALETEDIINAGEETTLTVNLGDGNNPDAVGYALAFALEFNPALVDQNSIRVSFDDAFLGDDLISISEVNDNASGRLEIAASRKDQLNTTTPGGKVCTVSFIPLNPDGATSFPLELNLIPNAFVRADQSSADIAGSTVTVDVQGASAVNEPAWATDLSIYPNPYTSGPLSIRGNLPALDAVKVLDLNGRTLAVNTGDARRINLEALPAGAYYLQIESEGEVVNRKVIKR